MASTQKFASLRGFRDFPPEEMALRQHIMSTWREVSARWGLREYDGPPLESLELYREKSGDEIVEQLYAFEDKGGRSVALRPEMTPTLARMLADRSRALPKPIRWTAMPQLFRYERQQRGRLREHFQWNVDLVGEEGIEADAEVLAIALDALRAFGFGPDRIRARISDRRLLTALLVSAGVPEDRLESTFTIVDKVEREGGDAVARRLREEVGLDAGAAEAITSLFEEPSLETVRATFGDDPAVAEALGEVDALLALMDDLGFGDHVEFDLTIVRGLAYYTGPVFEIFDRAGVFRAICGGGRYDRLLEKVGGESLAAVGFGMGDVVLGEFLKEAGLAPEWTPEVDYFVVAIGEEQRPLARRIAGRLRESGHSALISLRPTGVGKQFKQAASEGARSVVVLGPEEIRRGVAVVRDMADGEEREVPLDRLSEPSEPAS
ncbi:MAG: histidine--tRNA ligase [Gemmatimonadales bacterium]|nr:MAG: histidine--tRNA ligase [Gemmatimonadales bacterium]